MNLSKSRSIVFILAIGGLVTLVMIVLTTQPGRAAGPWYVAPGGDDGNDCLSPAAPCASINGALGKPGFVISDTLLVATGTYTGTGGEVVLLDKSATLSGGWDANFTTQSGMSTIDGEGSRGGIDVNVGTFFVERFIIRNSSGCGIDNFGGILVLSDSAVSGNTGGVYGGGIKTGGAVAMYNSIISDNTADYGGGIWNSGTLIIYGSTISNNMAGDGGGIYNPGGTLNLNNSTLSGNAADGDGGAIKNFSTLTLNNSTVSGNTAQGSGGGISSSGGTATLQNSVLTENTADTSGADCNGTIGSAGYNLVSKTSGCTFSPGPGDLTNVDADLGLLLGPPSAPWYYPPAVG